jgi:hypothetical protein
LDIFTIDWWLGLIQFLNYFFHLLATIGISSVLMLRLSVFYTATSALMMTMYLLVSLVIVSKAVGDGYGMVMSLSIMRNEYLRYEQHPYFLRSQMILGIGASVDMLFSVLGSVGFLYALYAADAETTKKSFIKDVLFEHEGYRLVMVCFLHMFICGFAMFVSTGRPHTHITHTGLYIPSWVYALELRTFLELSYVTAKEIILKQGKTTSSAPHSQSGEKKSFDIKSRNVSREVSVDYQEPGSPRDSLDLARTYREYQAIHESSSDDAKGGYNPYAHSREVDDADMTYSTPSSESSYAYYDALNDYSTTAKPSAKKVPQYF